MDPLTISGIISALATLIGGIVTTVGGAVNNDKNIKMQQDTNEKNEQLTKEAWQRDDSELQRKLADAQQAGFSPLAALGSSMGNTNPTEMVAPQGQNIVGALGESISRAGQKGNETIIQKNQIEQMQETTRGLKLDNDIKESKAEIEIQEEAEALAQLYQQGDLKKAEYIASLMDLKARGLSDTYIDALIQSQTGSKANYDMHANEIKADQIQQETINKMKEEISLSTEQRNKIKEEVNKIKAETDETNERLKAWTKTKEGNYYTEQLKKLKEEAKKAQNDNEPFTGGTIHMPYMSIGGIEIRATDIGTTKQLEEYKAKIAMALTTLIAQKDANLQEVIKENGFLQAMEYIFGGSNGPLELLRGLIK